MPRPDDLNIVLTGAAGGIGTLVARGLRAAGAAVTGIDRGPCPECSESLIADLASADSLRELARQLAARRVDVLINLAGVQYFGPFEAQAPEAVAAGYAANLIAPTLLAQAVLPQMRKRRAGQVVNIGSVFGAIPFAHFVTYSAAKAGMRALSQALRRELAGSGVRVTHIAPRAVRTPFNNASVLRFAELTGMRMDPPERVAGCIVSSVRQPVDEVVIGFPESLFVRINALAPRLVDRALGANDRKAAGLFDAVEHTS